MKILKISGKNLASLAGEFCVDFEQEPLASSGLFAISGPTGAGKTTLLDALCLALYDATPRLLKIVRGASILPDVGQETVSAQDPRTLLRRGAAEAWSEVDFIGNDKLRYRARWNVRRARGKAAGSLQKSTMTLHQLPDMAALGATKTEVTEEIVRRVGLTFEQFTRAVLLAQNEFSAFLKTEENERGELLETLTGSVIYSAISRRAFERFKDEQAKMQQLSARLADHTPLGADARSDIEAQCATADAALALADARQVALEQQLRWHQETARLLQNETGAEQTLATAHSALEAASERRAHLALLDAVQPARPLAGECSRLALDIAGQQQLTSAGATELARVEALQQQAAADLALAAERLQGAEQTQRAAAPQLDQAKALDAAVQALAPSHATATEARDTAQAQLTTSAATLASIASQLDATRAAHVSGVEWLDHHKQWETLAAQWPRWDTLFAQAEQAALHDASIAAQLATALLTQQSDAAADAQASTALADTGAQLAALETARQQAIATLAGFDGEQLQQQRAALDQRSQALVQADRAWTELAATRARLQQAHAQSAALATAKASAAGTLETANAQAPVLAGALAQAERALQGAEIACADNVVDLRATLADGTPCPVCGSEDHPYQHQNAALHDVLAGLRDNVATCRAQSQANVATQATQRALLASSEQQQLVLTNDASAIEAELERCSAAWDALALHPEGDCAAWLANQLATLKHSATKLELTERAMRDAVTARDAAQRACDVGALSQATAQAQANAARAALAASQSVHAALAGQRAQAAQALATLARELDGAFASEWQADPALFRQQREADVHAWRDQSALHASRAGTLAAQEAEQRAASQRHTTAQSTLANATAEFARVDADIKAKAVQRAALWNGHPVSDVEQELAAAIEGARATLASRQGASEAAAQADTRARESLAQAAARLATLQTQAQQADERLSAWLASHPHVTGKEQLDLLLAQTPDWIAGERAALQALDTTTASAATILAERRSQRELHQLSAPADTVADAATLATQLEALAMERKQALDAVSALRLQLAQDDVRRANAQAMMADIEQQQQVEMRWARMNELIGSADGKKFRNYAQQFTLDVLLGYANSHLGQLAKRYRLERVAAATGPSLGLLVRDQDMGGEIRSVNSLSGGESFLVSLALALGLASLSSNRVRVESLFIDEGFGSLDSETLRVAMDALDGLQSMGRKVGVISHVQEMTERIATRILVQPAGGGTSSVTVQ